MSEIQLETAFKFNNKLKNKIEKQSSEINKNCHWQPERFATIFMAENPRKFHKNLLKYATKNAGRDIGRFVFFAQNPLADISDPSSPKG